MSVPSYRFTATEDLPTLGLAAGEYLLIAPCDSQHPISAAHPIDISPAQFFDAVMAGTLKPEQCATDDNTNPLYAIRDAMRWPWQGPATATIPRDTALSEDEAADAIHHACVAVTGTDPDLVTPELYRRGYRMVGPKPTPRRSGLRLETG